MGNSLNIISANDLRSGLNVYFIQDGEKVIWDTDISQASVYTEEDVAPAFARAEQDINDNVVVDCLIVAVDEKHKPLTTREKIRANGPSSNYGK